MDNMKNNSIDFASLLLQIINLELLFKDFNNTDLMQELKVIIEQNNEILKLLKKGSENNGRKVTN